MESQPVVDPEMDRRDDIVVQPVVGDQPVDQPDELVPSPPAGGTGSNGWKGKDIALPVLPPPSVSVSGPGPLTLMKLPVDILSLIFNEVASNSRGRLVGLLATNSTLHNLVAPYIHSSFDIIWPDENDVFASEGVDALTHGLAALTLGSHFARTIHRLHRRRNLRRGPLHNNYAQYTRSFCMGNGLPRWVTDYSITTESGKMLNTLVSLAIQKMINLESFKWDMPTGLSSDVFMALSSLQDLPDGRPCKLEQVWVRWHDSRSTGATTTSSRVLIDEAMPPPPAPFPPAAQPPSLPSPTSGSESAGTFPTVPPPGSREPVPYSDNQVEYPTFSVLPPLKSITALEIDQVAYLDELSVLVEISRPILKELRLSISSKVKDHDFTQTKWRDPHTLHQVDFEARWPGESNIGGRRLGGVMGVALGRVYDLRKWYRREPPVPGPPGRDPTSADAGSTNPTASAGDVHTQNGTHGLHPPPGFPQVVDMSNRPGKHGRGYKKPSPYLRQPGESNDDKLALNCLELERIPLHTLLCVHAIDWTVLTSLTILRCRGQEKLWRALRERYEPTVINARPRRGASRKSYRENRQYHLSLKRIHIDVTTFALMNFLKEALAPNSIEVLYLHDRRRSMAPHVPLQQIFEGPIKRQHASLKKLLLDSSHPDSRGDGRGDGRRMCWAFTPEMLSYIASGKMGNLRELSTSLETATWHSFLQTLPNLPQLTCLLLPSVGRMSNNNSNTAMDSIELGLQVVDVIALRPEIRLRFLGIRTKRFEIMESRDSPTVTEADGSESDDALSSSLSSVSHAPSSDVAVEDEDEIPPTDDESELGSHASRTGTHYDHRLRALVSPEPVITYRLREIFYEEKIDIFKAKLGKL